MSVNTTPFSVELVSGPTGPGSIDDFELTHARRTLAKLKALLGRQGLLELLARDIEEGNAHLQRMAMASGGKMRAATTILAIRGLRAADFVRWLETSFASESVLLAGEPEHFVIAPNADRTVTLVEYIGPHITRVQLPAYDAAKKLDDEPLAELLPVAEYPFRRLASLGLSDGTVIGRVLTQFGDTESGFTASLTCYFPIGCPAEISEHHSQHFAVEFRNWITAAAASVRE